MNWLSVIAIYLLVWTVTLFVVLPFGVRTSDEAGEDKVAGQADSSPARPMLLRKFIWTSVISAVLMALFWGIISAGLLTFS